MFSKSNGLGQPPSHLRLTGNLRLIFPLPQAVNPKVLSHELIQGADGSYKAVKPFGFPADLKKLDWTGKTSIGGQWDWDDLQFGCVAGASVFQPTAANAQLVDIDKTIDDGNLNTGGFRSRNSGYISIIE